MSPNLHKSCYTSRSSGYKYRTLSTNTGERRRGEHQDNAFDSKLNELQREITFRVNNQVNQTQKARESIHDKLNKLDERINSMLALQDTITALRKDLVTAGISFSSMLDKVNKMESASSRSYSFNSKKCPFSTAAPKIEQKEIFETNVTPP